MPKPISAETAARHEALHLRLAALCKQAETIAARKPGEPVPDAVRALAEDGLFEARIFRPHGKRDKLPPAAPDYAGLTAQLGQALAALTVYEAAHSTWSTKLQGFAWHLPEGDDLPIRRLVVGRGPAAEALAARQPREDMPKLRAKLAKLIDGKRQSVFEAGRRAGLAESQGESQAVPVEEISENLSPHIWPAIR